MTATEFSEAKTLWKMFYSSECFRRAGVSAQHILNEKMESDNPLFSCLMTATYVNYAKPFTHWKGVEKLDEVIVPKEYIETHNELMKYRHTIYAHLDSNPFPVGEFGPPSQVRVLQVLNGEYLRRTLYATDFHVRFGKMPEVIALCEKLVEKTSYHVNKLWNKHHGGLDNKPGECVLNILDENGNMWIPDKPMMGHWPR